MKEIILLNFTLMLHGENFDKLCNTQCRLKACVLWAAEKGHPPADDLFRLNESNLL
jgi:hypothetical protein